MMNRHTVLLLFFLIIGFVAGYFIFDRSEVADYTAGKHSELNTDLAGEAAIANPFAPKDAPDQETGSSTNARLVNAENEIEHIKQQLVRIEKLLKGGAPVADSTVAGSRNARIASKPYSVLDRRLYKLENLIKGGVDPTIADDIVRKKNSVELQRLELQDRAKRKNYLNTQQYYDELESIDQQDVSLREVLGDDRYDEYLFNSKQNNRIRIASVMLGSSAEQAGIQKGDVILSYDDNRMFRWQELKNATTEGQLGDYVSISIYRDGEIYSFSVPRGPLGVQLGATRLQP